jgi:replicative DNA helicase Mcm
MATTTTSHDAGADPRAELDREQFDELIAFIRDYYREELGEFLQRYPDDTTHFEICYQDLEKGVTMPEFSESFAEHYLADPEAYDDHLSTALDRVDMPLEMDLEEATVQVVDLPEWYSYYPGEFSPKDEAGHYRSVTGEIARATDVYARLQEAAFECQRCATITRVPQTDSSFQEPHECQGCERQGPFSVDLDRSSLIDAQMLRLQTPPEVAQGAGQEIDVYLEGEELVDMATVGDRVTVTGTIHLEQLSSGGSKTPKFEPYL